MDLLTLAVFIQPINYNGFVTLDAETHLSSFELDHFYHNAAMVKADAGVNLTSQDQISNWVFDISS